MRYYKKVLCVFSLLRCWAFKKLFEKSKKFLKGIESLSQTQIF